jgi:hypothetical protein
MNDDVPSRRYLLPVAADDFPQAPPHAVAHHRAAQSFLDAEPEAADRLSTGANEYSEVGTRATFPGAIHQVKLAFPHQLGFARKLLARCGATAITLA